MQDVARFVYPSREFGTGSNPSDDNSTPDRSVNYDSTATASAINLQTSVQRLLLPQAKAWAQIVISDPVVKKLIGANAGPALAQANDTLFNHLTYSNFYPAFGECVLDDILFGSTCLGIIDKPGTPLSYYPVPIDQVYFLANWDGIVDVVFREHTLTARQLKSRYQNSLPSNIAAEAAENSKKRYEIIECVIPDGAKKRYAVYVKADWTELESSEAKYSPFIVFRWETSLGSCWGGSPCRNALPHIRGVNRMVKTVLASAEFSSLGLFQTDDESLNAEMLKDKMVPGSVIPGVNLQPVPFPGNYQVSSQQIENERQQIRNLLYDLQLQPQAPGAPNTYMSATEVAQRRDQFLQKVGQPSQRLQWEALQIIANQAVARLIDRGEIAKPPPELLQTLDQNGIKVSSFGEIFHVEVNAAISAAIKLSEAQNDLQIITNASAALAQLAPEIRAAIKINQFIPQMLIDMGMSADLVNTPDEMAAAVQAEQQAQQQQAMLQQATALGDAGSKINKAMAPGSAVAGMATKAFPGLVAAGLPQPQQPQARQ